MIDDRIAESGWLSVIRQQAESGPPRSIESLIEEAWLRTLSRMPRDQESQRAIQHVESAESLAEGLGDLMWALINTKEYLLIH